MGCALPLCDNPRLTFISDPIRSTPKTRYQVLYVRSGQNSTGGGGRRSEHESRLVALPRLRVRADHALTRAEVSAPALA
jgi:hypothetical protein